MYSHLICPVCGTQLRREGNSLFCERRHCFDFAKEGYVNLSLTRKNGDSVGDNREMALSRRAFLSKGYFSSLADALCDLADTLQIRGNAVDICCGEGYYSAFLKERRPELSVCGFDLSREMVRLAAKRRADVCYFVANLTHIPLASGSMQLAFQFFSPFCAEEYARILAPDGVLISAVAGARHLWELKEILYEQPYLNDEKPPDADGFVLCDTVRISDRIRLADQTDIQRLFRMTPYFYHTPTAGKTALEQHGFLETTVSFVLYVYRKAD